MSDGARCFYCRKHPCQCGPTHDYIPQEIGELFQSESEPCAETWFRVKFAALVDLRDRWRLENGNRLRFWREMNGLSLRYTARRAGISPSHLSDIEKGRRGLTAMTLQRVLSAQPRKGKSA